MNKSLEALEFVKTMPHENGGEVGIYATDKWATIEKELKAFEIIKREPFAFASFWMFLKEFDSYEKWEKVNPNCFTKEEYELLKEVLHEK